jgi:TctA family transporter
MLGVLGATCALALAWNAEGSRERLLLTHATAVLGALWLMTVGSSMAAGLGRQAADRPVKASQIRLGLLLLALMALGAWLVIVRN